MGTAVCRKCKRVFDKKMRFQKVCNRCKMESLEKRSREKRIVMSIGYALLENIPEDVIADKREFSDDTIKKIVEVIKNE